MNPTSVICYALWAVLAGMFIPVMGVLNARLGKSLGEPLHAAVVLFSVGLIAVSIASMIFTGRLPLISSLATTAPVNLLGGFIVGFYVVSITFIAPHFGIGNAILFAVAAQVLTSASIDHFGLFGTTIRSLSALRVAGIMVLLLGLFLTQFETSTLVI